MQIYILNYSIFEENASDTSVGEVLCFPMIVARTHSTRIPQEKILDLGWSVQPHLLYSANLTLYDFHLFRFLQNTLNNKKLSKEDQVKRFMENLLNSKPSEFYLRRINLMNGKR